jgi:hypothetical protein
VEEKKSALPQWQQEIPACSRTIEESEISQSSSGRQLQHSFFSSLFVEHSPSYCRFHVHTANMTCGFLAAIWA